MHLKLFCQINQTNKTSALTDQEQVAYDLIVKKEEISGRDVEEKLGVSQEMSGRILKQLVIKGAI